MSELELVTTEEAAAILRMDARFVRDEFHRGRLRGSKFGHRLRFTKADLAAYVKAHANVTPPTERPRRRRTT